MVNDRLPVSRRARVRAEAIRIIVYFRGITLLHTFLTPVSQMQNAASIQYLP